MYTKIGCGLLSSLLIAASAHAGSAGQVKVRNINFMAQGVVIFYVDGARSNAPSCATESARFAINATTAAGKVQLAGLLTAYTAGKPLNIYGTNSCSLWGDTETVDFFHTVD